MQKVLRSIRFRTLLRPAIGLFLLLTIGNVINLHAIADVLANIKLGYLILVLALISLDRFMMAAKWQVLLRAKGTRIPLVDVIKAYYIGNFMGLFLPPTVGVDFTRALHLNRYGKYMPDILSSIVIERIIGFLALATFSLVGALIAAHTTLADLDDLIGLNLAIALAGCATVALSVFQPLHRVVFDTLNRVVPVLKTKRFVAKVKDAYLAYQGYQSARTSLVVFTALTLLETCIPIAMNYSAGLALGLNIVLANFVIIIPITLFVQRIPFLPSFIGVREGTFVVLFAFAGVTPAQAFSLSVLGTFMTLLAVTPGLAFYLLYPFTGRVAVQPESRVVRVGNVKD